MIAILIINWKLNSPKTVLKFLAAGKNKEHLIQFLFQHWSSNTPRLIREIWFYFGHVGNCHLCENVNGAVQVQQTNALSWDHEEADKRLLLHALIRMLWKYLLLCLTNKNDNFYFSLEQGHPGR